MHDNSIVYSKREQQLRSVDAEKGLNLTENSKIINESGASTSRSDREGESHELASLEAEKERNGVLRRLLNRFNEGRPIDTCPPPDGGVRAWVTVVLCHMALFTTFGFVQSYGVLQTHYVSALDLPASTAAWIGSLSACLMMVMATFSGRLTDAGYFHQTLAVGTFLQLLGYFTTAVAKTYWQLLLSHGLCIGLGGGLVFCPCMSIVGTYFSKHRSLALAICAIGNSVGGLAFAAVLRNMIPSVGFPWAMRTCGFIVMASMVPANLILKPRVLKSQDAPLVEWKAFTELTYCLFALGMFFTFLGMWVPVFYLGSFGRDIIGLSSKNASSLLLLINGVGIAGRVLPALAAHRFGPLNLMIPLTLISGVILFCWAAVKDYQGILVFDVIYGFIMAAGQGMLPPSLGSLTSDLSRMGVRMGMVFSICGLALLIGQPLGGVLVTADGGDYLYTQMYSGAAMTLGSIFMVGARISSKGWKLWVKV
ncbi:MFS general substrate transporter [Acephala macrosclerotiorum]|nr:MFS general substrate transporter [Acephala macrosclerotiorum]